MAGDFTRSRHIFPLYYDNKKEEVEGSSFYFFTYVRRLDGPQINHQIYLKFEDVYDLYSYKLLYSKKKGFIILVFSFIFLKSSSSKEDQYGLKMATPIKP